MNKLVQDKEITIVGASPGGLTLARPLQMNGADVKVYDRDLNRHARAQGATLDLHDEPGLKALRGACLVAEFKASYRSGADKVRVVNRTGLILVEDNIQP